MKDSINFIELEEETINNDSRLSSNQLKTKPKSFEGIAKKWREFRIEQLNKKLEKIHHEEARVNDIKENIMQTNVIGTTVIERLKQKIDIFSKDKERFESNSTTVSRAINLRLRMFENMIKNSNSVYKPKLNSNEIKANKEDINPPIEVVLAAGNTNDEINVEKTPEEQMEIAEKIDQAMNAVNQVEVIPPIINSDDEIDREIEKTLSETGENVTEIMADEEKNVNEEEISVTNNEMENQEDKSSEIAKSVIDDIFEDISEKSNENNETEQEKNSSEIVKSVIEDIFGSVQDKNDEITKIAIENTLDNTTPYTNENEVIIKNEENDDEVERKDTVIPDINELSTAMENATESIKVSHNGVVEAKVDKYDINGLPKQEYNYTPMTDEEIETARFEIENYNNKSLDESFDSYQQKTNEEIEKQKEVYEETREELPIRDEIQIVPDRDEATYEYTFEDSDEVEENLHFDYTDATPNDVLQAATTVTSLEQLEALKMRVLKIKEENQKTNEELNAARKEKENEEQRAREAKSATEEVKRVYNDTYKKLTDYYDALDENKKRNNDLIESTRKEIDENKKYIEEQNGIRDSLEKEIEEMNSLFGDEAVNVRGK